MVLQADSEGGDVSFETLISQMCEFLLTVVGNSRLLPLLAPVLPELAYLIIGALHLPLTSCCKAPAR
jgi:hypothetical protein